MNKVICPECQQFHNEYTTEDKTHRCPKCVREERETQLFLDDEERIRWWTHQQGECDVVLNRARDIERQRAKEGLSI